MLRVVILTPALLLAGACWTPGPGQVDPTRYPWDQRARPSASYCVMVLETPAATGIVVRGSVPALEPPPPGGTMQLTCKEPPAH